MPMLSWHSSPTPKAAYGLYSTTGAVGSTTALRAPVTVSNPPLHPARRARQSFAAKERHVC